MKKQKHRNQEQPNHERTGIQLTGQEQQLTLFPSEQEQRQSIAEAESVETPSAFSISDVEWDGHLFQDYLKRFQLPADKEIKSLSKGMKMKLCIRCV